MTSPIITLEHFARGPQQVYATIQDGRRVWLCPNRPMMRPWEDCFFTCTAAELDERLAQVGWKV
jgi:hypothetical protein